MTDQSLTFTEARQIDPITTLMGTLPARERDLRLKLHHAGNLASCMAYETESPLARDLCWMVCELTTTWKFAPAHVDTLERIAKLAKRLTICANDALLFEAGV